MTYFSAKDYFEEQYVLRKTLPTFASHVAEWEALSQDRHFAEFHTQVVSYGSHSRQTFELFKVKQGEKAKGLAIFIHGGFWRAMDREQSRFVAKPFLASGYDCVIAEYRLMPAFALADLVEDTAMMLHKLKALQEHHALSSNILLSGHSAGAHLAIFGLNKAKNEGFSAANLSLLLLSGVFDIFPVSQTSIGDELDMPQEDIARWSVYEGDADNSIDPLFLVGADETDDFKRQSIIGAQQLGAGHQENIRFVDGANHLTLMTKLATDPVLFLQTLSRLETIAG
ncbi:MAG: alpha/beta hydrolase [Stappiaceae bacterium]